MENSTENEVLTCCCKNTTYKGNGVVLNAGCVIHGVNISRWMADYVAKEGECVE